MEATIQDLISCWRLLHDYVIRIRTFFFVWILNASVSLIDCCWYEFKVFVETSIYKSIIMLMGSNVIKTRKFWFIWMLIASVYLINFCSLEFLGFCATNHAIYESITMRMLIAYWRLQNKDISLCLNVDCLYLFYKLLQTWFAKFFRKQYRTILHWCMMHNMLIA